MTEKTILLPYEKCKAYGFESLSDEELIAIIIRSGTKKSDCMNTSKEVLKKTGSSLIGLWNLSLNTLKSIDGIGEVKAIQLKSICELSRRMARQSFTERLSFCSDKDVAGYCMEDMRHLEKEHLRILLLDTKNKLLHDTIVSVGTVNTAMFSTREICKIALQNNAVSVILVHNHPSGDPVPSKDDIISTARLKNALGIIGIELIDHIIIGDNRHISMKQENIL